MLAAIMRSSTYRSVDQIDPHVFRIDSGSLKHATLRQTRCPAGKNPRVMSVTNRS